MKARFLALAALVLGLASCQTEPEGLDVNVGGEVDTVVTVSLPETTRANSAEGAFKNVDLTGDATIRYILKIYQKVGDEYKASTDRQVEYSDGKSVVFPVRLVPNRDYRFVVWADYVTGEADVDYHYNTTDLANITLNGEWKPMDETRDAFTGYFDTEVEGKQYTGTSSINLTLKRPFAKLRVITTDMVELGHLDINPAYATVEYNTPYRAGFNAFESVAVAANVNDVKSHAVFEIAAYDDNTTANKVLFTDYLFAEQDVVKFTLSVYEDEAKNKPIKSNFFNTDIAVNRNYLTTIKGNVLTDGNNIKVDIEDAFEGNENWPDENEITEQLAYAAMFGGEVSLTADVALTEPLTIVEGANVVINLEGKTLTGAIKLAEGAELTVNNGVIKNADKTVSGITSNGDLTLNNVTIESARHGVRVESGNVVINGGEYKVAPISNSTLHALNVGDDGTTANVVIKGGTFIGPKGTMADSGSAVNVRNGSSVVIEGGNFSGGKSKTLSGENITVKGGTFDQNPSNFLATGYKAIVADGLYYVLPEIIADAAETAGVTSVTESTADVATALATNNGEATMFMWNDVAYIAKYGEVVITSAADEATTVRGVVEYSTDLNSATVADGIEVVGNRTFRKCANLETVALPNTLTEIGPGVFQSCSKLANITIPESVTTIGEAAFAECSSLESINIPAGVTRIEADALRATGLVSVEFHEGVTYFGAQAFRDCKQLKEVIIKAPVFTVEANAFGVMAGTLPGTKIYVANAEMKAYLESTLAYKNQFEVIAPNVVNSTDALNNALKDGAKIVTVSAGEYTFPSSVAKGVTINCAEGTVFTGTSDLNINGATVIGAEFKNENGTAVSGTIYGNFKNCTFTGSEALRWCYSGAGKTTVFENCVIKTDFRGFHYDGMNGDVIFRNCEINGFNAYGGEGTATFEGCTFGCDESRYNGLNIYSNTNLINCTFNFVSGKTNFIDMEGTGKTLKITNCKATLDGADANIEGFVGGSKLAENTVIYE